MKRLAIWQVFFLLASVLIMIASCKDEEEEWVDNLEFEIVVPVEWAYESDINDTVRYYAASPINPSDVPSSKTDSINEDMIITREYYPGMSLEDYFSNALFYLEGEWNYDSISTENITTVKGLDCVKHVHLQSGYVYYFDDEIDEYVPFEAEFKMIKYYLYRNDYGYIISCGMLPDTYDNYASTFENIVNTIVFKQ
ncbi:MAG: hypothetical protein JXB19_03465 [Bacteroidales bacterium]|nr:hypothetical protein [Bacteroidales bacterium]